VTSKYVWRICCSQFFDRARLSAAFELSRVDQFNYACVTVAVIYAGDVGSNLPRLEAPVIRFATPGARFVCGFGRRAGIFKTPDRGLRGK
jgi:hypothetical protein